MKKLEARNSFKKDMERVARRGRYRDKVQMILRALESGAALPDSARPHRLSGDWGGAWECHVAPDLLLVYECDDTTVTLIRLGSHSDLF